MQVDFHKTIPIDDTHYIDLLTVNGTLYTMLMHKVAEPNVFAILKRELGDTTATIVN
jgi:hypothetical protein